MSSSPNVTDIEAKETDRVLRNRWLLGANKQLELVRRIPPTLVRLLLGPPSGNERVDVGALDKRLDNPNDVPGVLLVDLSNNRLVGMPEDAAAAAEEKDDIVVVSLARSDCCCSSLLSFGVEVDGWWFLSAHPPTTEVESSGFSKRSSEWRGFRSSGISLLDVVVVGASFLW